jgi:hypothetical protein
MTYLYFLCRRDCGTGSERLREGLLGWPSSRLGSGYSSPRMRSSCVRSCPPELEEVGAAPSQKKRCSTSARVVQNEQRHTNDAFNRVALFSFVDSEHMANGIAQREFGLEIRAIEHVSNAIQVAGRENPILRSVRAHAQHKPVIQNAKNSQRGARSC